MTGDDATLVLIGWYLAKFSFAITVLAAVLLWRHMPRTALRVFKTALWLQLGIIVVATLGGGYWQTVTALCSTVVLLILMARVRARIEE